MSPRIAAISETDRYPRQYREMQSSAILADFVKLLQQVLKELDIVQQSLYEATQSFAGSNPASLGVKVADSNGAYGVAVGGAEPGGQTALERRFAKAQSRLSPSRRKLLRMILETPEDTYYLSSRELAKHYKVDAATIVRTIQVLGYRKFAEFVADLRSHFVTHITPYAVLKAASREKRTVADRIRHNIELDLRNLQALQSTVDSERIVALSRKVKQARRILVVGIDLAAALSWYLAYGLMTLGFAAEAPVGSSGNVQRRVRSLNSRDLLIAISFGQCLRDTVEAAQRAKKQGVPTFGITDSETSPVARVCNESCFASVSSPSFVGSYVAPFSLLGAVLTACAHIQTARALELLRRSEEEDRADHRWYSAFEDSGEAGE